MRDWISGAMLVLGTLLVLAGAVVRIAGALGPAAAAPAETVAPAPAEAVAPAPAEPAPAGRSGRFWAAVRRMPTVDPLIAWGIVLLALAALVAGAVAVNLTGSLGTR